MHKVNSCIWDSSSVLTSDNYWTTQKFNRMNDNLPTYENPPQPPPKKVIIQRPPTPPNKKLDGDIYEGIKKPEPPPTQIIQDGVLPPNNKIPIGEIREDAPTENKYFNAESIRHIIIFAFVCLILKYFEIHGMNIWNKIKIFYSDNISYFALAYLLFAIIIINRFDDLFFKPSRQENDRITKWLNKNL